MTCSVGLLRILLSPYCFVCDKLHHFLNNLFVRFLFCFFCLFLEQGILSLCVLFENLLQAHEPALFYHLKEVGAHP